VIKFNFFLNLWYIFKFHFLFTKSIELFLKSGTDTGAFRTVDRTIAGAFRTVDNTSDFWKWGVTRS